MTAEQIQAKIAAFHDGVADAQEARAAMHEKEGLTVQAELERRAAHSHRCSAKAVRECDWSRQ